MGRGASDLDNWELVILNLICWVDIWSPDGNKGCLCGSVNYDTQIFWIVDTLEDSLLYVACTILVFNDLLACDRLLSTGSSFIDAKRQH